jgi:tetratricopeptide (TPR) repeat protein
MKNKNITSTWLFLIGIIFFSCQTSQREQAIKLLQLGNKEFEREKHEEALKYFEKAIEKDNNLAEAWNNKGTVHFFFNEYDKAKNAYQKAIEIKKEYAEAIFNISNVFFATKQYQESLNFLNKIENIYKDSTKVFFSKAKNHLKLGNFEQGIEDLNKVIALKKDFFPAYDSRGYLKLLIGNTKEALQDLEKAAEKKEDLAISNLGLYQYFYEKNYQKSLEYFAKAIQVNPDEYYAYNCRAYVYLLENKLEEAQKDIEFVMKNNKENALAHRNKGILALKKRNFSEASLNFQKAFELDNQIIGLQLSIEKQCKEIEKRNLMLKNKKMIENNGFCVFI